jgi:hypothetical protein
VICSSILGKFISVVLFEYRVWMFRWKILV